MSSRLDAVERTIGEKMQEIAMSPRDRQASVKDEMDRLLQEKHKLQNNKQAIADKMRHNDVPDSVEQR